MDPITTILLVAILILVAGLSLAVYLIGQAMAKAADTQHRIDDINAGIAEARDPKVTEDGVFKYWELPGR